MIRKNSASAEFFFCDISDIFAVASSGSLLFGSCLEYLKERYDVT